MFENTAWSLLPPLLAITLAILTRRIYLALGAGVLSGAVMLESAFLPGIGRSFVLLWNTLSQPRNALLVGFILAIGALISSIQGVGGIKGFVLWLETKGFLSNKRSVRMLAWWSGVCLFIESNMTILLAGTLARPLFDKWKISREKLAYLIDSTSGPICLLIPLNAWGIYVVGLLETAGAREPLSLLARSIPYNFYSLAAVLLALYVALTGWSPALMKQAEERTQSGELLSEGSKQTVDETLFEAPEETARPSKRVVLLPILAVLLTMPVTLYLTGREESSATTSLLAVLGNGKGGVSLLTAASAGLGVLGLLGLQGGLEEIVRLIRFAAKGARQMFGLASIILLALTLGSLTELLGTGQFVAQFAEAHLSAATFLPVTFVLAAFVSFSTGTSWGTFAIMIPVVLPTAHTFGAAEAPFLAAALSGGIFGDHASPISNTTIIASMAARTGHIDHVQTQLPYCLLAGAVAVAGYFALGYLSL